MEVYEAAGRNKKIIIKNARVHNLKGIDVSIPKYQMTVITGVSGSGKSSLAFDILYEEGKRRYLMFSGTQFMMESAENYDSITGLSPTVAVEQRIIRQSNPRSTVGTRVKLSAMLAALYANYGVRALGYEDKIPLEIAMFQKNSPKGMCVKCLGNGMVYKVAEEEIFCNSKVKLYELFGKEQNHYRHILRKFLNVSGVSADLCLEQLTEEQQILFKYGGEDFEGVIPWLINVYRWSKGKHNWISKLTCIKSAACPKCGGTGLGEQASHTTFGGKTITELEEMYLGDLHLFLSQQSDGSNLLLEEILTKLACLIDVGLHHLSLNRQVPSLSGGEIQRLFLASYIIAEMDSIIFVFDEPTIGLHEVEKQNLLRILKNLVKRGNTVVAVEHDENFMKEADYIIDLGPGAGNLGGRKIYEGNYLDFLNCTNSKTAPYLSKKHGFPVKTEYRAIDRNRILTISNANLHNLKAVQAEIPLGILVGVAGVSGSGKSSLISDTLVPLLKKCMKSKCIIEEESEMETLTSTTVTGTELLKRCYVIDQKPIARSRTSCPATYTGVFDRVRTLFAETELSKQKGYRVGLFSVNSEGGCQKCKGDGIIHYHIGYGNFIDLKCEECGGSGYIPEALEVTLDGKNIREVLELSVDEAIEFFHGKDRGISTMLNILQHVGMGYIKLGQATPTISGGESQRIKLAKELAKGNYAKNCLYILDEPTTGLSFSDSERLMELLNELVDCGNSIIITEHDPYMLSNCDYLLELGRGGGSDGGQLIAVGTPKELKENTDSIIGKYLLSNKTYS